MSAFQVTLPSGAEWTPTFVQELNEDKCIGCGRCFKVCPRGVLELVFDHGTKVIRFPSVDLLIDFMRKSA